MENPRPEKVAVVDEVRERFGDSSAALAHRVPRPRRVAAIAQLRRSLREAGGDLKVYKNTLVRFAARDLGLEIEDLLTGPTAIAFVDGDPVNVAKALRDFARTNPALVVKGGLLGNRSLTAAETQALADVEPREVLLAKLAGALAAPMQQFAGLLQALPRNLAYGLQALIDQQGGVPEAPRRARRRGARRRGTRRRGRCRAEAPAAEAPAAEADAPSRPHERRPKPTPPRPRAAEAPAEES